jgi:hypothetical protein
LDLIREKELIQLHDENRTSGRPTRPVDVDVVTDHTEVWVCGGCVGAHVEPTGWLAGWLTHTPIGGARGWKPCWVWH